MSLLPVLPLLNRNLPQVVSCNDAGLIAYGARSNIYVVDLKNTVPVVLDPKVLCAAHRGKVLSVSFCKFNESDLLASIGDEALLKIWDLETASCITSKEVKDFSHIVEWPYGSSDFVVFPDRNGCVGKWNFRTNKFTEMKTCSDTKACCFSSNKKSPDLLAVGHNSGSISILNLKNEVLLRKFKNHVMEITSLSWSLISPTLLLSGSVDQTARIWNLEENTLVQTYNYPRSRYKGDDKKNSKICAIFHPDNSDTIICSNVRGDVASIVFKENEAPKIVPFKASASFSGFKSIIQIIPYLLENDERRLMLTVDHLKIALWDILEQKLVSTFSFCSGRIYDLALSTIDPSLLAIGSAEGFLKVWDMSKTNLEISTIYVNSHIKIMVVAWHPTEESIIAYGSDEGRVGVIDIHKKKYLYSYETHHSNAVYALQWAPCKKIKDSDNDFFLYSCGSSSIFINELFKWKEKASDFNDLITVPTDIEISKSHSEFCWKSDYTCLAVGSYKGGVSLFDDKLNFLSQVSLQMKSIECLKWHPRYTSTSPNESSHTDWLATAGNDEKIFILNTSDIKSDPDQTLYKPAKTLIGHKKRVSKVCWSPHTDGLMASASRDGTVLIWNVITSTILANYAWHKDLVFIVQWSAYDPDIIFSGGMDCCLRVWNISEQSHSAAPEKSQVIRRKRFIKTPKTKESALSSEHMNGFKPEINERQENPEVSLKGEVAESIKNEGRKTKKDYQTIKELQRNLFYNYATRSKEESLEKVLKLADVLSDQSDSLDSEDINLISNKVTSEESLHLGLYCDQLTAIKMCETKAKSESESGMFERAVYLQLMSNDVKTLLTNAAEEKHLSDFLLVTAATVSRKFYNEMCEKYSAQLIEEKNYVKASMYLLLCGQLYNAISLLLDKGKILEALALAKARLPENDPFLHGVLRKTANYFSVLSQMENEAACYLALKEPLHAARILYRSPDSKHIYASLYICKKFNLNEAAESYGYFCLEKCLAEHDWTTFHKAADLVNSLKVYNLLVRVHELFITCLKTLKKEDGLTSNKIFGVIGSKPCIWESRTIRDTELSFIPFIYNIIKNEDILPEDRVALNEVHNALKSMEIKRKKYEMPDEVHITVAVYISQIIVTSLLGENKLVAEYFVKIFLQTCNVVFMPRVTFWLLLPFNLYWSSNEDHLLCESAYSSSELLPFTDFFQDTYKQLSFKFASVNNNSVRHFSIGQDILLNLKDIVKQTSVILSEKTLEDSLLLFFAICYLNELRKLAKQGWKFRCYTEFISDNKLERSPHQSQTKSNGPNDSYSEQGIGLICDNTDQTKKSEDELQLNGIESKNHEDIDNSTSLKENVPIQSSTALSGEECEINQFSNPSEILKFNGIENDTSTFVVNDNENEKNIVSSDNSYQVSLENRESEEISGLALESNESHVSFDENAEFSKSNVVESKDYTDLPSSNFHGRSDEQVLSNIVNEKESSLESDEHAQCWADVSLYYILVKSFISIICRDEYALLFFLKKIYKFDHSLNDQTKDQSPNIILPLNQDCLSDSRQNIHEPEAEFSVHSSIQNLEGDSDCLKNGNLMNCLENECKAEDVKCANFSENENKDDENQLIQNETDVQSFVLKNNISSTAYDDAVNNDVNSDPPADAVNDDVNSNPAAAVIDIHENDDFRQKTSDQFQIDEEKSELVKHLNSVKFFYPNPFDAVSALNGICHDIVHKNPCQFVKEKFHELAHEISKWNCKFSSGNEVIKCNVCQENISA